MVTHSENNNRKQYVGLSTDTKPTDNVPNGSVFFEMDTFEIYIFDKENSEWLGKPEE